MRHHVALGVALGPQGHCLELRCGFGALGDLPPETRISTLTGSLTLMRGRLIYAAIATLQARPIPGIPRSPAPRESMPVTRYPQAARISPRYPPAQPTSSTGVRLPPVAANERATPGDRPQCRSPVGKDEVATCWFAPWETGCQDGFVISPQLQPSPYRCASVRNIQGSPMVRYRYVVNGGQKESQNGGEVPMSGRASTVISWRSSTTWQRSEVNCGQSAARLCNFWSQ